MAGMKPVNIQTLIAHSTDISNSYYRPIERDLLEDYLKVADLLTISEENHLEQEIATLKVQSGQADPYKQVIYVDWHSCRNTHMCMVCRRCH
jgi:hypothetical protein